MFARVKWGVGFGHFQLQADPLALRRAADVFKPWLDFAGGELLGEWRSERLEERWRLFSPRKLQPLLEGWGVPDSHASLEHLVRAVEFQATALAIVHPESPLGMHGALLASRGKGVALVGDKEAGKSTLSAALWRAGFDFFSDDGFFFKDDALEAHPVPRRSRLRGSSRDFFPHSFWSELAARPTSFSDQDGSLLFHPQKELTTTPLGVLILLSAQPGPVERLTPADALVDLVRHTYRFVVSGAPATLRQLQPVTERIACYRMGRAELSEQIRHIEELLG